MQITFLPSARAELSDAVLYYEARKMGLGVAMMDELGIFLQIIVLHRLLDGKLQDRDSRLCALRAKT